MDAIGSSEISTLCLVTILCQLNEAHRNSELCAVQNASWRVVRYGPNILERFHRQLRAGKEGNSLATIDLALSAYVGSLEQSLVVLLLGEGRGEREREWER